MDSLAQLSQKVNTEQTTQSLYQQLHQQQQPTPDSAPPPYMPSEHDDFEDDSDEDSDEDNEPIHHHPTPPSPLKLTLNAAHNIQGCNNLVPTSPSPLADATRFSTLLLAAVQQLNAAAAAAAASEPPSHPFPSSSRRSPASKRAPLSVDLTINCGVTIVGDRNVVGNVCLKPKAPAQAFAGPAAAHPSTSTANAATAGAGTAAATPDHAVVGAKRKVEADGDVGGEGRWAKKVAMG
ncbi:hypothetical protein D0863_08320 [Hortaea werneckii]|uniref:Uncharacterized protein n=1 Tax=Hortaea werneckii TaxID=91943 RepID=A0A3M7DQX2_HORWE|nr:hypothetical protein D0863_08320 [Hortaea werneckii]